eukprot:m.69154 g.69154  ORF g.69154 m.69154 type:complete len:79 (+) comp35578_c0_seq2:423-659(+)
MRQLFSSASSSSLRKAEEGLEETFGTRLPLLPSRKRQKRFWNAPQMGVFVTVGGNGSGTGTADRGAGPPDWEQSRNNR